MSTFANRHKYPTVEAVMDKTTWTCKFTRHTKVATAPQKNVQLKEVFSKRILWWTGFGPSVSLWIALEFLHHIFWCCLFASPPSLSSKSSRSFCGHLSELCTNYKYMLSNPTFVVYIRWRVLYVIKFIRVFSVIATDPMQKPAFVRVVWNCVFWSEVFWPLPRQNP